MNPDEKEAPNKFGVRNSDFDNFGDQLTEKAFEGVTENSLKTELAAFGESLTGFQKAIFQQILRLFFGRDTVP